MSERHLSKLWRIAVLGRPIGERRTEPVNLAIPPSTNDRMADSCIRPKIRSPSSPRSPSSTSASGVSGTVCGTPSFMRSPIFHCVALDLAPRRVEGFCGTCCGQDREPQRTRCRIVDTESLRMKAGTSAHGIAAWRVAPWRRPEQFPHGLVCGGIVTDKTNRTPWRSRSRI